MQYIMPVYVVLTDHIAIDIALIGKTISANGRRKGKMSLSLSARQGIAYSLATAVPRGQQIVSVA